MPERTMTVIDVLREDTRHGLIEVVTIALLDEPSPPYSWNEAQVVARRIVDKIVPPSPPSGSPMTAREHPR